MPRRLPAVLLAALASTVAGCSASGPPELTVYADGKTMQLAPVQYCDVRVTECEANPQAAGLMTVRPDRPMQISVPPEVAAGGRSSRYCRGRSSISSVTKGRPFRLTDRSGAGAAAGAVPRRSPSTGAPPRPAFRKRTSLRPAVQRKRRSPSCSGACSPLVTSAASGAPSSRCAVGRRALSVAASTSVSSSVSPATTSARRAADPAAKGSRFRCGIGSGRAGWEMCDGVMGRSTSSAARTCGVLYPQIARLRWRGAAAASSCASRGYCISRSAW